MAERQKGAWWLDPFGITSSVMDWGSKDPEFKTKDIVDPMKKGVATPYSEYLKTQIGKGVPRYEGAKPWETEAYKSFAELDPGEWFQGAVADPAMKEFKEELLPEIREGYAGSLRGSGRFRAEEAGVGKFSEYLATERTKAMRDIPKEQYAMASQRYQAEYAEWTRSLPQFNPALQLAQQFLSNSTSTGTTTLAAMDPGSKGYIADIVGMVANVWGMVLGSGQKKGEGTTAIGS